MSPHAVGFDGFTDRGDAWSLARKIAAGLRAYLAATLSLVLVLLLAVVQKIAIDG